MAEQLYTVKRHLTTRPGGVCTYEILGPGAPERPIASGAIANMMRDALEDAGKVLVAETRLKLLDELGEDFGYQVMEVCVGNSSTPIRVVEEADVTRVLESAADKGVAVDV